MKKIPAVLSAALLLGVSLSLASCTYDPYPDEFNGADDDTSYSEDGVAPEEEDSAPVPGGTMDDIAIYTIALPEGRVVDCVSSTYGPSDARPDCDWGSIREGTASKDSGGLASYTVTSKSRSVLCIASEYGGSNLTTSCDWAHAQKL